MSDREPPPGTRLRVLVVDHRRAFSEGLAHRLAREPDVLAVAVAASLESAESALDLVRPTVAAVTSDLRDGDGLLLVTRARRTHPEVRWVVVGDGEPLELADALVAGASGYVTMSSPVASLAEALRGAVLGLSVTPDELLRRALVDLDAAGACPASLRRPGMPRGGGSRIQASHRMASPAACSRP